MGQKTTRIGLVGYGQIGRAVHEMIDRDAGNGMEVVFVHDQVADAVKGVSGDLVLGDLSTFGERGADLVVEMAHPSVTQAWGAKILEQTNYMMISVTALADRGLEQTLEGASKKNGTRCYIPHGGAVGLDALYENRDVWEAVTVTMKKPPKNVDCTGAGVDADSITEERVLYEGPVRGACPMFPRNVNTMASIAYAGIGFDRTHAVLIVSPAWNTATVAVEARAPGLDLDLSRVEGITGVTGASTPASIYNSVQTIASTGAGIHLR